MYGNIRYTKKEKGCGLEVRPEGGFEVDGGGAASAALAPPASATERSTENPP